MAQPKEVKLTTDGACIGNPGPGGWACLLRFGNYVGKIYGCTTHTTNNRMELEAVIQGLKALREPCLVTVFTDSQYVQQGITKWLSAWKVNGWKKSRNSKSGRTVLNQDLWQELDRNVSTHTIHWNWVKGHANDADNIACDALANRAAREQISSEGVLKSPSD